MSKEFTRNMVAEMIEEYLENEYKSLEISLSLGSNKDIIIDRAISRGLGVTMFAQSFNIPYDYLESLYYDYKEKIEKLR